MKTTGFDSGRKLIINDWGFGKTGERDKIASVPGSLVPRTMVAGTVLGNDRPGTIQNDP
jgi:hypothetical protein